MLDPFASLSYFKAHDYLKGDVIGKIANAISRSYEAIYVFWFWHLCQYAIRC